MEKERSCPWALKRVVGSSVDGAAGVRKGVCNVAIEPFSEHNRKRDEVRVGEVSVGS